MSEPRMPGLSRRPLPSFDEWLEAKGNGERGDGFEAFRDLAERTHAATAGPLNEEETAFLRMWMGMQIAVTELCNIEHRQGRRPDQIIQTMSRVLAAAAMYSIASVLKSDAPMRQVSKIIIEEFRFAAKQAADELEGCRK